MKKSDKMKKVCIITTVHSPLDTRIFYREALSLSKKYKVTIVAPGEDDFHKEKISIKCIGKSRGRFQRFLKSFSALKQALKVRADLYHFHDPELIIVGLVLELLYRKPVIYDVHENNPEYMLDKKWIPGALLKKIASISVRLSEYFAGKFLSGVVVVNDRLLQRFKRFNSNTELIINFPDKDFAKGFSNFDVSRREKIALYIGSIEKQRGVLQILEFVKKFPNYGLKFLFIGTIKDSKLRRQILDFIKKEKVPVDRFEILSQIPQEEVPKYLNIAFIGIVPFLRTRNNYLGTPLKMFEYIAYGLPIVASDFLFLGKFIRESGSGLLIKDPENINEYKKALDKISSDNDLWKRLSSNGRKAFIEKYNWDKEEVKLFNLYKKILKE